MLLEAAGMRHNGTLIVVDMQAFFDTACDPDVIIGVTEEILEARRQKRAVILLEYDGCGRSHEGFANLLKNYPRKARIRKKDDDGSLEVIRTLRRRAFPDTRLRICGVNADCCVCATVWGLLCKLDHSQIEGVKKACGWENDFDWREYFRHPNLKLV
jgi:nicotinamidase-related amidase